MMNEFIYFGLGIGVGFILMCYMFVKLWEKTHKEYEFMKNHLMKCVIVAHAFCKDQGFDDDELFQKIGFSVTQKMAEDLNKTGKEGERNDR